MSHGPLLTKGRIGVLMGGQSSEREVSLRTGAAVHGALCRRGYDAVTIDVGPTLSRDLQDHKIAIAFLALHDPDKLSHDIYLIIPDGSDLRRMTDDGELKNNIAWQPVP